MNEYQKASGHKTPMLNSNINATHHDFYSNSRMNNTMADLIQEYENVNCRNQATDTRSYTSPPSQTVTITPGDHAKYQKSNYYQDTLQGKYSR